MLNTYYLIEDGQQTGPFSHHELMDRGITAEELVLSPIVRPEFCEDIIQHDVAWDS